MKVILRSGQETNQITQRILLMRIVSVHNMYRIPSVQGEINSPCKSYDVNKSCSSKIRNKKNTGVVVVKPKHSVVRCVFVSRFSPKTTPADIKNIIFKATSLHLNCRKLNVKYPELYASFCINATDDLQYQQLLNPDIWPDGILVMPFMGRSRRHNINLESAASTSTEHDQRRPVQHETNSSDVTLSTPSVSAIHQASNAVNVELNTVSSNYESNTTEAESSDCNDETVLHVSNLGEEDTSIA